MRVRDFRPPPEPYWTKEMVKAYVEAAADTMWCLPPVKVQGYFSVWPDLVYDDWDRFGWSAPEKNKRRPTPRAIDQMEYVCSWLHWVTPLQAKIVWRRADRKKWKQIEYEFKTSVSTLKRRQDEGLTTIVAKLNAHDPEGVVIRKFL